MDNKNKYWLAFASIEKIGSVFIKKVYEHFGCIKSAWCAGVDDLYEVESLTRRQISDFIKEREKCDPDKCIEFIESKGINFITFEDDAYPKLLKQISNPPMTLFYKGDLSRCNFDKTISVVGSRKASDSAKNVLTKILSEFKGTDVCIVSGLALGIDSCAHKAALNNGLSTIGVIASGFDYVYPSSNRDLYKQIENSGGVIFSEYWPTFAPIQWRFPHRNRIVTGLSKGTMVAEAALKSGALISANLCLEQNRELMCMPGMLTNPNTEGIYKLIKNGAAVVTCFEDILDALDWKLEKKSDNNVDNGSLNLSETESRVFNLLQKDSLSADEIAAKLSLDFGELMVALTELELKALIAQSGADKYYAI